MNARLCYWCYHAQFWPDHLINLGYFPLFQAPGYGHDQTVFHLRNIGAPKSLCGRVKAP